MFFIFSFFLDTYNLVPGTDIVKRHGTSYVTEL